MKPTLIPSHSSHARPLTAFAIDQLFIDGSRQHMARYPDYNPALKTAAYQGFAADATSNERAARWANPTGGYIHAKHKQRWGGYHYRITGNNPDGSLAYEGGWQNNRQMGMHRAFRMVENIFEELDVPGEWFHNAQTYTLYFKPQTGTDLSKASVEVVELAHLIEFKGSLEKPVKHIQLQGLTFRHTARTFMNTREPLLHSNWTIYRGGAVMLTGTEDIHVLDSTFNQPGGNAVFMNFYNRRALIKGCHIHYAGASGVCFVGDPEAVRDPLFEYNKGQDLKKIDRTAGPKTENYPADSAVEDCLIEGIGRVERQPAGVQISMARRITVRDTTVHDCARTGINVSEGSWGGHLIERCDAHSLSGDPMFVDPASGDFRVKDGSPALKTGFKNFPMDQFGVKKPALKAIAKTPVIPALNAAASPAADPKSQAAVKWLGATLHSLQGEEFSAFGVSKENGGVQLVKVPENSDATRAGLQDNDLVQQVNGMKVSNTDQFFADLQKAGEAPIKIRIIRNQQPVEITIQGKEKR